MSLVLPRSGALARAMVRLCGWEPLLRARRAVMSRLPFVVLESDVVDVVYATWVVDAARVAAFAPPGITLWQRGGRTLFTILSYRHGGFGPRFLGPLRRLLPSPLQSNWRLYVDRLPAGAPAQPTVLFTHNMLDSLLHVVAARVASDALPSHLPAAFSHRRDGAAWETRIGPGRGSAAALQLRCDEVGADAMPPQIAALFGGDRAAALDFVCLQHAAVVPVAGLRCLAHAGIALPIDLATVQPLACVRVSGGPQLQAMLGDDASPPWCFRVPRVNFRVLSERLLDS